LISERKLNITAEATEALAEYAEDICVLGALCESLGGLCG